MAKPELTQRELKHRVDIGPAMGQVSPVGYWYKHGHYPNDEQARGAFDLAWQQYMDGMGKSAEEWMGLTTEEVDAWHRDGTLPGKRKS